MRQNRRQSGQGTRPPGHARATAYRRLRNPFTPQRAFSDDAVASMHENALKVLETLGIKVLLPEARALYAQAGALVDETTEIVRLGRDIVAATLESCPRSFEGFGGDPGRAVDFSAGSLVFIGGSSCPNVSDLERGRRPGSLADFVELIKLSQHFDVLHVLGNHTEPQDVPVHLRHYAMMRAQLTLSDKMPIVMARGTAQVEDSFAMIRLARGHSEEDFRKRAYTYTVINSNSPRVLDRSMAQGIIDFARYGQPVIMTPFCLAGAMAPITIGGALTLQHAEALAGIALAQLACRGAPLLYGSFLSNVDMKSGSPAFGTPTHLQATLGAGQLARLVGLPWRAGAGTAANVVDAQAALETQFSLWASTLAGATVCLHAAGWMEGGLTNSYEKCMVDVELLQMLAELCTPPEADEDALGYAAIAEVSPGGHFFAAAHTMARYRTAFHEPMIADWSNFGTWTERGSLTATDRAHAKWKQVLAEFAAPPAAAACAQALDELIARRTAEGGAPPLT
ncbi:MAG TPA: trimethylamine methyltransferase family protein [Steroidobacteraceae bacterium]|nr:trimethylamine methyltransferase family protein [Steroidobacteraceae bacterium]